MDRLGREGTSVGRRIWRRRKRKTSAHAANAVVSQEAQPEELDLASLQPVEPPVRKVGMLATWFGALSGKPRAPPPEPSYLVLDPTRDVLAVPRGVARLDAFERALQDAEPGTPQLRSLALAFHKELSSLADSAGVDLSLLEARVEACAQALMDAGENERAGGLLLRVGRRHQAAERFVAAGAIDALEEAHALINWDEGGVKHEARMSFERFEALYVVGMREQAFEALEKAGRLWRDNPVYGEIHAAFVDRLGPPGRLMLSCGNQTLTVLARWPIVVGRGEEAGVRIQSPMLSRAHLQIELGVVNGAAGPLVVDLDSRGGTRIDGVPLSGKQPLRPGADIDMAGVVVKSRAVAGGILLWAALSPAHRTMAATTAAVKLSSPEAGIPGWEAVGFANAIPPDNRPGSAAAGIPGREDADGDGICVRFDAKGRASAEPGAVVNGDVLYEPLLLLQGDKLSAPSGDTGVDEDARQHWTVAR